MSLEATTDKYIPDVPTTGLTLSLVAKEKLSFREVSELTPEIIRAVLQMVFSRGRTNNLLTLARRKGSLRDFGQGEEVAFQCYEQRLDSAIQDGAKEVGVLLNFQQVETMRNAILEAMTGLPKGEPWTLKFKPRTSIA